MNSVDAGSSSTFSSMSPWSSSFSSSSSSDDPASSSSDNSSSSSSDNPSSSSSAQMQSSSVSSAGSGSSSSSNGASGGLTISAVGQPQLVQTVARDVTTADISTRNVLSQILTWLFGATVAFAFVLVLLIFIPSFWPPNPPPGKTPVTSADLPQQIKLMQEIANERNAEADKHWSYVKDLLTIVLPAETGLLGAAFGFYFGIKAAQTGNQ